MPKKTKRQKMATEVRKHKITEHMVEVEQTNSSPVQTTHTPRMMKKPLFTSTSIEVFKQELKKSLIITIFLLIIEIGIYIGQQQGISFNINLPF
ncbi:hypothetical protein BH09PAT2_BH09PAT2_06780 [soil metagenome]